MSEEVENKELEQELLTKYGTPEKQETVEQEVVKQEPTVAEKEPIEEETPEKIELDPAEITARSNGWDPDKGNLTASEFNLQGKFIGQMREYQKQIKNLHQTVTKMTTDQQKREDAIREQTVKEMEVKRREAVETGDVDSFDAYDKQLKEYEKIVQLESPSEQSPQIKEFLERNKHWYNDETVENYEMSQFAMTVDNFLHHQNANIPDTDTLKVVESEIRKRFPERFKNTKKEQPSPVASSHKTSKGSTVDLAAVAELTPLQKDFYEQACKNEVPGMTGKEYLKALKHLENNDGKL